MKPSTELATRRERYAGRKDFCAIFQEEMHALFSLALLLTADREAAGQCFLAAFEDCLHGAEVFRGWERSWSRRAIVKQAIRMVGPRPGDSDAAARLDAEGIPARLLQLPTFARFVFAMTVLERFTIQECAVLLRCVPSDVEMARRRALQSVGSMEWPIAANDLRQAHAPAINLGATA